MQIRQALWFHVDLAVADIQFLCRFDVPSANIQGQQESTFVLDPINGV
jgi:hypothetical protein